MIKKLSQIIDNILNKAQGPVDRQQLEEMIKMQKADTRQTVGELTEDQDISQEVRSRMEELQASIPAHKNTACSAVSGETHILAESGWQKAQDLSEAPSGSLRVLTTDGWHGIKGPSYRETGRMRFVTDDGWQIIQWPAVCANAPESQSQAENKQPSPAPQEAPGTPEDHEEWGDSEKGSTEGSGEANKKGQGDSEKGPEENSESAGWQPELGQLVDIREGLAKNH